jgi:hypothetical protein
MKTLNLLLTPLSLLVLLPRPSIAQETAKPVPVTLLQAQGKWTLVRGGKPYFIKGAGGWQNLDLLAQSGGNSIRTWGTENAQRDLDAAQKRGLTVTLGMWLGHKEHGFKYDDPKMVADQLEKAKADVLKYRSHPSLLAWGIGNEMETGQNADPNVWKAVEEIAKAVKQLDPNHPTMTVVAELGRDAVNPKQIAALCPDIDILGVNSYAGLLTMPERLKAAGWTKPYVVTEFGPPGPWEVGKTAWGAALEPNSTEKAGIYLRNYQKSIEGQPGWCLGSYCFLWGNKVEATPTWFGMLLPDTGEKLGTVDAMTFAWTGKYPEARAPEITRFECSAAKQEIAPGSKQTVTCLAQGGAPGGKLTYRYEIRPEGSGEIRHEPGQQAPAAIAGVVPPESEDGSQSFTAPTQEGAYRLYLYVRDGKGAAATANVPFLVKRL